MHPQWCLCGFLWTPQRTGFVPNSSQSAEGQLAEDAHGQVHPWCDTMEADGIESAVPVKHLCHRSFFKRLSWWILLSQSYFWLVTNPLGKLTSSAQWICAFSDITYQNRRPLILDCGLGGFADLPLSQEINDFKPCSRFQNTRNTDMKYKHKLIETDCSSCLWSYNLFFHIMHHPNQNTVVSVLSALHWLKKNKPKL